MSSYKIDEMPVEDDSLVEDKNEQEKAELKSLQSEQNNG